MTGVESAWDDARWLEPSDSPWQAGLRWQQAWWRQHHLGLPPGPFAATQPDRLVASTLPLDAPRGANFLTPEAHTAAEARLKGSGGGLVKEDRLRRNLLSSQPMCFNLFGLFQQPAKRAGILGWVTRIAPSAVEVTRVEIEWAPPPEEHFSGGSAFDAFVEYRREDDRLGFLGIECKYHEDLRKSDVKHVREVYRDFTRQSTDWHEGAEVRLDRPGLRQFWLNTLLAQSLCRTESYAECHGVVVACAADRSARASFAAVRGELADRSQLTWQPWEEVVAAIGGEDQWRQLFIKRYLDFTPVVHLLDPTDPRRGWVDSAIGPATAAAVAARVLGEGSVLERLAESQSDAGLIWVRLGLIVEELKQLRVDAGELLGDVD